jgi:RNA polymerase primary sigma factor
MRERSILKTKKNSLSDYMRSLYKIPTLTTQEEQILAKRIAMGDEFALEKLVTHNLRFAVTTIKNTPTWKHSGVDMEDLIGFGNEALLLAARKWKPIGNIRFVSYARQVILTEVNRGVANTKNLIRLPVNITEEIRRMRYTERILTQELGREPTTHELAKKLNVSPLKIAELNGILNKEPISLENFNTENLGDEAYDT